jgi:hypothetical protein
MLISNKTGSEAIQTTCSPKELSEALQALHLEDIPLAMRKAVIMARLGEVILNKTTDPVQRMKPAFEAIEQTYWERKALQGVEVR